MHVSRSLCCAIVLRADLPPGLAANAAAVLAAGVSHARPELIGPDVRDGSGDVHPGITTIPLPVLRADANGLGRLACAARQAGVAFWGFTDLAQSCHCYDEYASRMASTPPSQLRYVGVSMVGDPAVVKSLTGQLGLYR